MTYQYYVEVTQRYAFHKQCDYDLFYLPWGWLRLLLHLRVVPLPQQAQGGALSLQPLRPALQTLQVCRCVIYGIYWQSMI